MAGGTVRQQSWRVAGLDCPDCVALVERSAREVPGVLEAHAELATGRLTATIDEATFAPDALLAATAEAGHPLSAADAPAPPWRLGWTLPVAAAALVVGLGLAAADLPARPAYGLAAALGLGRLAGPTWQALRLRTFTIDSLMVIAIIAALALGDWFEAALLAVLFTLAETVEAASHARTARAVGSLLDLAPRVARVERQGAVVELAVEQVAVGELLRLRPGDVVPLDGQVVSGAAAVDEATLTGESVPREVGPGDVVYAGSVALDGALAVEVTRPAADSAVARLVTLVEQAQSVASPTQRTVDRFAAWYTPLVVALAVGVWVLGPLLAGLEVRDALYRGTALLVLGCPCAIVLATPLATASALTWAARHGILVRGGGASLERAAGVATVALDKTGTLTVGTPRLERVVLLDEQLSEDAALALAAAIEVDSSHPLALALVAAAEERGLAMPVASGHTAEAGRGVRGVVAGRSWSVGRLGDVSGPLAGLSAELGAAGLTTVVLADDQPRAVFGLAAPPRPEAAEAAAELRALARVVMLTGDRPAPAAAVARAVGLDEVRAELLPADKQAVLAELRAAGPTMMVGDGLNDAPALAAADVGLAVGALSSQLAQETADISLLAADLRGVPRTIRLARALRRTIAVNIALALAIRVALVPLAMAGLADLWVAVLGDVGGTLAISAHSLRLLRGVR